MGKKEMPVRLLYLTKNTIVLLSMLFVLCVMTAPYNPLYASSCSSNVDDLDDEIEDTWILGLKKMAEQLTATIMMQGEIIGTFFDAKLQLETQMLLQEKQAEAHKDYMPSEALCKIGTMSRSLAYADAKSTTSRRAIAKYMLDRELVQDNLSIASSPYYYMQARVDHFREFNCDINDNDSQGLELMCREFSPPTARRNRDIDYSRLIDANLTLDIDFSDQELTTDEEDLISLGTMLFSQHTFTLPPEGAYDISGRMRAGLMEMRSLLAIKGVAKDSFAYLAGTRAASDLRNGDPSSTRDYMIELLKEMGMGETSNASQDEDIREYLGENYLPEKGNPSYHAQMELLTKKIYQDPQFITNLIDTPANVERQRATMRSVRLQQDWDIVKAMHRREMLLSLLLELRLRERQEKVESRSGEAGERREIPQR